MKKIRKLATKLLIAMMVLTSCMSVTVYGMTAKDVTAKTPKSYVAGTNSIYGPKLSQAQLNSVAQATADFMNKKITKNMTTDAKIRLLIITLKTTQHMLTGTQQREPILLIHWLLKKVLVLECVGA